MPTRQNDFAVENPAILVVDDERPILNAISRLLQRYEITVHTAIGPDEAREKLKNIDVQVVCSDIRMKGENGIRFLKWVRAHYPNLQRILLTAYASHPEYLTGAINEAGVHRFLAKPFDPPMLVETIKQSVEQWAVAADRDRLLEITNRQNTELIRMNADLEVQRARELRHASTMWRCTFDAIADPLVLVNTALQIQRTNRAAANLAGSTIKDLLGRACHEALFGQESPDGCSLLDWGMEKPREFRDERNGRLWTLTIWPLQDDAPSDEAQMVCHYQDVTDERALQHEVVMLDKLAAVGELAGCVAHELNNPLTGILAFSQLIRGPKIDCPKAHELAQDIEESARRCTSIVKSLLDFSRPSSTKFEPVQIPALLDECGNMARFQMINSIKMEFKCEPELPLIWGNVDQLKSVFLNLINNAVQAIEKQGEVLVSAYRVKDSLVRIEVTDSGPGVPPDVQSRIFEPFFTTKAKNRGGTGLGLAIVDRVVRDHQGSVVVHNLPEGGACFTVELPVVAG